MRLVVLVLILLTTSCSDRVREGREVIGSTPGGGTLTDAGDSPVPDDVRSLCSPGTARCIQENLPLIERCGDEGEALVRDSCAPGEVCRNRRCVPFACTPGTSLCVGNNLAVCDPTGTAIEQVEACDHPNVCEGGRCVDLCEEARLTGSYLGCEYVATRLQNFDGVENSRSFPFGIVVANPNLFNTATVSFEKPFGARVGLIPRQEIQLAGGEIVEIGSEILTSETREEIVSTDGVIVPPGGAAVILPEAGIPSVEIRSDRPIAAYQFNPYCCNSTFTNDASLLFPVNTWSNRYRGIAYPFFGPIGSGYLAIYSTEPRSVTIENDIDVLIGDRTVSAGTETIAVRPNEITYIRTGRGENTDLSGIELTGDGPFAVFSGHPCTYVPEEEPACDHLEEQLPPADTLGRDYFLTPVRERNRTGSVMSEEGVYWRVSADEDVSFTVDPAFDELDLLPAANDVTPTCRPDESGRVTLSEGETCSFGTARGVALESTGPVAVAGVISGQNSTGLERIGSAAGDPALFILPPAAQFRRSYSFVAPPTYARNFVSVAVRRGEPVVLDGRNIETEFRLERQVVNLGGTDWELFTVPIEPGLHLMESEEPFGIVVYAFDDYVSYAFVGGLDLLPKGAR